MYVDGTNGNVFVKNSSAAAKSKKLREKININFRERYTAPNDAIPNLNSREVFKLQLDMVSKSPKEKQINPKDWQAYFENFKPADNARYNRIVKFISDNKNLTDKSLAPKIAKMVYAISEQYGIPPEITVSILRSESGGYQFTPKVMVHSGSIYKGVMQVDLENIKILYADEDNANNKSLSEKERAIAYSHRFFRADNARINELKQKYPTSQDLYKAIQEDVALGIEVGLMVFKSKLVMNHGNVDAALSAYGKGDYKKGLSFPRKISPIPEYRPKT